MWGKEKSLILVHVRASPVPLKEEDLVTMLKHLQRISEETTIAAIEELHRQNLINRADGLVWKVKYRSRILSRLVGFRLRLSRLWHDAMIRSEA